MKPVAFYKKPSAFTRSVGIQTIGNGRAFRLKIRPCHANVMGHCHGGAIFTLADRAFACAVNSKGKTAVAMEMKINYLAPVKVGDLLEARAKTIKQGRSTTVCLVEILRKKELAAVVLATAFNVNRGIK
jgi:acyl-CoA thioesterase